MAIEIPVDGIEFMKERVSKMSDEEIIQELKEFNSRGITKGLTVSEMEYVKRFVWYAFNKKLYEEGINNINPYDWLGEFIEERGD